MPWAKIDFTELSFDPTPVYPRGYVARRPYVNVTLMSGDEAVSCLAVLDTGADGCTFPMSFARRLKLYRTAMKSELTHGVTGAGRVYYADIDLEVVLREPEKHKPAITLDIKTKVGFTRGLDAHGVGILGEQGFFDRYVVVFAQPYNTFTIYYGKNGEPVPAPATS